MRIAICTTQVPFARGGAEVLVESLQAELVRRGFECEVVKVPFSWTDRRAVLKSALAWRLLDLRTLGGEPIDLVIATRFPAYLIRHPNKVVWLVHQFRQVYELMGTPYSEYQDKPEDHRTAAMVRAMDRRTLQEARGLYTISQNTAQRLKRYNNLDGLALFPPPKLGDRYRSGEMGDYLFAVGRLDRMKRFDLLLSALRHTTHPVRCVLAGTGPEEGALREMVARFGLEDRVEMVGWIDDDRLLELYAGCFAVYYAPFDEDYGYVTIEAMKSSKPVVTTEDAGGVLEFVEDGVTGVVAPPNPKRLAEKMDALWADRDQAKALGKAGLSRVAEIGWDKVIESLTGRLQAPDPVSSPVEESR